MSILAIRYELLSMSDRCDAIRDAEVAGEEDGDADAAIGGEAWDDEECTPDALARVYHSMRVASAIDTDLVDAERAETVDSLATDPRLAAWIRGWRRSQAMATNRAE